MTEGTAGSTETGDDYEQGAAGTNKLRVIIGLTANS